MTESTATAISPVGTGDLVAGDLVAALEAAHRVLDAVAQVEDGRQTGWAGGEGLDPQDLREVVASVAKLEGRVAGLKLHVATLAERAQAAEATGATSTAAWAAAAGRNRHRSWTPLWLADLLDSTYHHTRAALAIGTITEKHAEIIVRAAESVPEGVDPAQLAECEAILVAKAERLVPAKLRRAAKRLLDPISKQLADAHEADLLEKEEARAIRQAFLTLGDAGDGTWVGKLCLPELHAQLLLGVLDHLSSPHRWHRGPDGDLVEDNVADGLSFYELRAQALCELIEHLPTDHLPTGAVTMVVHVEEEHLRTGLGAAQLDTGVRISAAEARRLACNAGLLPLVLRGGSVPLDLGTKNRLFSRGQALALSAQYDSCAAEGCDRPFSWCQLHHLKPWSEGGPTDLANAVPLCGHHHRRIHDPLYRWRREPDGRIVLEHRWRSRRRIRAA